MPEQQRQAIPIACDMSGAPDTIDERLAEYRDLFARTPVDRARVEGRVRFRLRALPGVLDQVTDLTAREKACCAFFDFAIDQRDDEIWWDVGVADDPMARDMLDGLYRLADR